MEKENLNEIELVDNLVDKDQEKLIFKELFQVENIQDYLKAVMAADIKRYFVSSKEQQDYIKGGYDKLMGLLVRIQKASTLDKE